MSTDEPTNLHDDIAWVRANLAWADPAAPAPRATAGAVAAGGTPVGHDGDPWSTPAPRRRRTAALVGSAAAAVALLAGGLALAAGGSSGHPTAPNKVSSASVLAAYNSTVSAQSARASVAITSGSVSITAQGVGDLTTGAADVTASLPDPLGSTEVRSTGQAVYIRLPSTVQGLAGGKPWAEVDQATAQKLLGDQLGVPGLGTTFDATGFLGWLNGITGAVTSVGTETIHGAPATHYKANVDLTKVAAQAPATAQSDIARLAQAAGQTIPVDVWIDTQGRLTQFGATVDLTRITPPTGTGFTLPASAGRSVTVLLDLWDFGTPVSVSAPPADQVSNVGSMLSGLASLGH